MALDGAKIKELLDSQRKLWEILEAWLFDHEIEEFTSVSLADELAVTPETASAMIQSYLGAQRAQNSSCLYVLKRRGRTSRAVWSVGKRVADVRVLNQTLFEDIHVKMREAWEPDLQKMAALNPRLARKIEARLESVIEGAVRVLAAALEVDEEA